MAEQEVRPQQLSIAEIARLWNAETGDNAEDIERELAEWAYAASTDGVQAGQDSNPDKKAPAKLKVEPDPQRKLYREDLETFCRESDRLLPHFWLEASAQDDAEPAPVPRDISRLVVRAMDRMAPSGIADASRRTPRIPDPVKPAATLAAAPVKPAAERQNEKKAAPAGDTESQPAIGHEDSVGPRRMPIAGPAETDREIRGTKKDSDASQAGASVKKSHHGPSRDTSSGVQDVPVKVMRAAPSLAAARPKRGASAPLSRTAAVGFLGGALIAAMAGAAWLEVKGPGLEAFFRTADTTQSELTKMERSAAELAVRAAEANEDNDRLSGQLDDTRRQNDTLRARIEDIETLGPRLTEVQESNAGLRRTVDELTAALDAARSGGGAAALAIEKELTATREALNEANATAQKARNDADRLTGSLVAAQGETEAAMLERRLLEQERDAGVKALAAANNEIENLVLSGTAAQAVVERLENGLSTLKQELQERTKDRAQLQARLATLNTELKNTRARAAQLSAVETETKRLGAALDAAALEIADLQTAAQSNRRESEELASQLGAERQTTALIRTEIETETKKNRELANDLTLAQVANAELRAEADGLNTQAAQLTKILATARDKTKALAAERTAAIATAKDLERDLNGAMDEAAALRASLDGAQGASAQLAVRLATAERRATALGADRQEAETRADILAKELKTATQAVAQQDAARILAQNRVESLAVRIAAANAEVLSLRTRARKAEENSDRLVETIASLKAEAKVQAANLAATGDILPQAGPPKETLIGAAALPSSSENKLDVEPKASAARLAKLPGGGKPAAGQAAKPKRLGNRMLTRGEEYLGHGDIASARLFFVQAAEQGDTAALIALGRTYDPRVLSELGVLGAFADPAVAARWYERAITAGDEEANRHLQALRAWQNS